MASTVTTRAAVLSVAVLLGGNVAASQPPSPSRLRTEARAERALTDDTSVHSATFRALVARLEQSAVVVYVRFGECRGGVTACLDYLSTVAGVTYLRATINRLNRSPAVLGGLLAHELFHAMEVADGLVTSHEAFRQFYSRHGRSVTAGYETDQARLVARRVEDEIIERPRRLRKK